jgi:hypothetical protein
MGTWSAPHQSPVEPGRLWLPWLPSMPCPAGGHPVLMRRLLRRGEELEPVLNIGVPRRGLCGPCATWLPATKDTCKMGEACSRVSGDRRKVVRQVPRSLRLMSSGSGLPSSQTLRGSLE